MKYLKNTSQIIKAAVIIIAIIVIGVVLKRIVFGGTDNKTSTTTDSSLEEIIEIEDLATLDYTYNAVAKVYKGDKVKYYVAYEGVVTAGINFKDIEITVDEKDKKISFKLPEVEILEVNVDMGTMQYIFEKERYETETVTQEAYKASKEDLKNRAEDEEDLKKMARENAKASIEALYKPWIQQVDAEYTIEIN